MTEKIDSYQLSTLYTGAAFIANSFYQAIIHQRDIADEPSARDTILIGLYAAVVSYMISFMKGRRTRVITSITSTFIWALRIACGVVVASYHGVAELETDSLVYWIISVIGAALGSWSIFTQYREHGKHRDEKTKEVQAVRLRFVA